MTSTQEHTQKSQTLSADHLIGADSAIAPYPIYYAVKQMCEELDGKLLARKIYRSFRNSYANAY